MIYESYYWKQPLLEMALNFKEYQYLTNIDEETYIKIEKNIFIGFYSIRKLLETETKITDNLKNGKHKISCFKHVGDNVTWRNNHKLEELYCMKKSNSEERDLWFISSRIVHSFIFNLRINENGGFKSILFTSDTDKNKKLYELSVSQIIALFELVGNDNVSELRWKRCSQTGNESMIVL